MTHLGRYLSLLYLQRVVVVALALVVLLGILDALSNADLLPENATMSDSFYYMFLRLPVLFDRILTFALLLGVMLTYLALIRRNELVPLWGAGLSAFAQIRSLLPAALLVGVISAILIDQTIPPAQQALRNWLGARIINDDEQTPDALWISEADRFVEIEEVGETTLHGLTMFERNDAGRIGSVSFAETGRLTESGWALTGVSQIRYDAREPDPPTLWTAELSSQTLQALMIEPRNLDVQTLHHLSKLERTGNRPSSAYLVWLYNRVSLPIVSVGFLILALAMMQKFGRNDRAEITLVLGMIVGFIYLIADGIFKSLAESGVMNAALATAIPIIGLYCVGLALAYLKTVRI